jgi:hypothetical protein
MIGLNGRKKNYEFLHKLSSVLVIRLFKQEAKKKSIRVEPVAKMPGFVKIKEAV